jgi:hypothetical protein
LQLGICPGFPEYRTKAMHEHAIDSHKHCS